MVPVRGNFAVNHQQIADLSAELIIRYYYNDYLPFLQNMDDDALWYGPAEGQFLFGRERMLAVWQAEEHPLRFTIRCGSKTISVKQKNRAGLRLCSEYLQNDRDFTKCSGSARR